MKESIQVGVGISCCYSEMDSEFGKGGMHFAEKLKSKKQNKKGHSNNGCPLPNVYAIKYIMIFIHSFIVKL